MKRYFIHSVLFLFLLSINSCGGGGSSSSGSASESSTTKVTVNISQARAATQAIGLPQEIARIKLTITGQGMTTVSREVSTSGKQSIQELFDLPNGNGRCFLAEAYDVSGNVIYKGVVYADLNGIALVIDLTIVGQDTTPPAFSGLSDITAAAGTSLTLSWTAATDNITSSDKIQYLIYGTTVKGTEDYATPNFATGPGATTFAVTGLFSDMNYCFTVRPMDEAGNIDTNTVEKCARTTASTSNGNPEETQKDTIAPTVPTDLTATATGINRISIGWNPSTDNISVSGYKIYRGGVFITTLTSTSWVNTVSSFGDPGLTPNTQYCYAISAIDSSNNESAQTAPVCTTTPASFFTVSSNSVCENNTACPAGTPVLTITFDSGTSPFFITSSNPQIIPNAGPITIVGLAAKPAAKTKAVSGSSFTLQPVIGAIVADTQITLTISDSGGLSQTAVITIVNQPGLYTDAVNGKSQTSDGSSINPFRSISKAVALASKNEIIDVAPGTYSNETFPMVLKNGMHLKCQPGATIVASTTSETIVGPGPGKTAQVSGCRFFGGSNAANTIFDNSSGLSISNVFLDGNNVASGGVSFDGPSSLTDSTLINYPLIAVAVQPADRTSRVTISRNIIEGTLICQLRGILSINGNMVRNSNSHGISIIAPDVPDGVANVYGNTVYSNAAHGIVTDTMAYIRNNIVFFNAVYGIASISTDVVINYNSIYCNVIGDLGVENPIDARYNRWDHQDPTSAAYGTCTLGVDVCWGPHPEPLLSPAGPPITTPCPPGITK